MSLFYINAEKCSKCGICAAVCPAKIITLNDGDALPGATEGADSLCIKCGHCVAVCPQGAFSHRDMPISHCPQVQQEWLFNPDRLEHFLRARRSIRHFKAETVEPGVLSRIMEIACFAPSNHNSQPIYWTVVSGRDEVKKLSGKVADYIRYLSKKDPATARVNYTPQFLVDIEAGKDPICMGAPHMIVAHAPELNSFAQTNCAIAVTYLELAAFSLGLGTCWAGYFNRAVQDWIPLQNALNIPRENLCAASLLIGYPKYNYHRLTLRNKPRITWLPVPSSCVDPG
jgi:nitroreductase/NAD-dependent dihydropyrimidine dehydrogenase PreA subunit